MGALLEDDDELEDCSTTDDVANEELPVSTDERDDDTSVDELEDCSITDDAVNEELLALIEDGVFEVGGVCLEPPPPPPHAEIANAREMIKP